MTRYIGGGVYIKEHQTPVYRKQGTDIHKRIDRPIQRRSIYMVVLHVQQEKLNYNNIYI